MTNEAKTSELIQKLYDSVVNMDEGESKRLSHAILDDGIDAYYAVTHGLTAAMEKVGDLYTKGEYFVPELLLCADALYTGLEILRPHIKSDQLQSRKKIIIGTIEGDIHDIGKNLVKIMFEAAGWEVHDLGRDVKLQRFVEEQEKTHSDVIALSALMTTSMLAMPKAIELIRAKNAKVAIMLGGAPLSWEIARTYGADGYARTAGEAVHEAVKMLERIQSSPFNKNNG
jgi:methanogenic corrinoid protein MtbC1